MDMVTVLALFAFFVLTADPATISAQPAHLARVKAGGLLAAAGRGGRPDHGVRGRRPPGASRPLGAPDRARAAGEIGENGREVRGVVYAGARGDASTTPPAGLARAVGPAVALDRGGHLADVASLSYYVPFVGSFLVMTILVVGVAMPYAGRGRRVSRRVSDCRAFVFRRPG